MKQLEKKDKENKLTPQELIALREAVNRASEQTIEEALRKRWMEDVIDQRQATPALLERLKEQIDRAIWPVATIRRGRRLAQAAAAVLIPVLMATTFYFYRENRRFAAEEMKVSAAKGEKASVTLPDGTQVVIHSSSSLNYSPLSFNRSERRIRFVGEAWFEVAKKPSLPFIIEAKDVEIKVLGTKFNLIAREQNETIELTLEEGSVLLSSRKEAKRLLANQKAIVARATGAIAIQAEAHPQRAASWKHGQLTFGNARLEEVVKALENNYGVRIRIAPELGINNDLFSGVITSGNLLEALEVLKIAYALDYTVVGDDIHFVKATQ